MKLWPVLRLGLALVILAASSLAVFQAPTLLLFRVAVLVTEFGHWLIIAPLLLALLSRQRSPLAWIGTAAALLACGLLISSAFRAQAVAHALPAELERALAPIGYHRSPADTTRPAPFLWRDLWRPPPTAPLVPEDCEYPTDGGQILHLRFFRSLKPGPRPCVVVIHGGGWENGTPDEFVSFNQHLAQIGYTVAAIEYRLSPKDPWPAQREDVHHALKYLRENAARLKLDPEKFVLLGRSAGGQIAEAVAYSGHDPTIRGCIAFYAPADLYLAYQYGRDDDILSSLGIVRRYMAGTPDEKRANYDSASSILLAEHNSPPTLLLHGGRDELVWHRQTTRLAERLAVVGATCCFVDLPWATHAFDFNPHGPNGQIATYAVETFLKAVTDRATSSPN